MSDKRGVKNIKRLVSVVAIALSVFLAYAVSALFFDGALMATMILVVMFSVIGGILSNRIEEKIEKRYVAKDFEDVP